MPRRTGTVDECRACGVQITLADDVRRTDPMPADVAAFPLEPGEAIISWRRIDIFESGGGRTGYVIRVRRADGYETVHDTYDD